MRGLAADPRDQYFRAQQNILNFSEKFLRNRAGPEKSGPVGSGWVQGTIEAASGKNSPACKPDLGISSPVVHGHFPSYFLYLFHQFAQLPAGREIEREGGSGEAQSQYHLQHLPDLISRL